MKHQYSLKFWRSNISLQKGGTNGMSLMSQKLLASSMIGSVICMSDVYVEKGSGIGDGFCRYDITTADILSMKLDMICLVSSLYFVFAKEMQEQ